MPRRTARFLDSANLRLYKGALCAALLAVSVGISCGETPPEATARPEPPPSPSPTPAPTPIPPPQVLSTRASTPPQNPLIVNLSISLDRAALVRVEYWNDLVGRSTTATSSMVATEHVVPVVRLRSSTTYSFSVVATDDVGRRSEGAEGTFSTGELPEALASIVFKAEGSPTSELVLMDYRDVERSYLLAVDQSSNIVWYYANPNPFHPQRSSIQTVRQKPDFNLVFYTGSPRRPCCLREITPLGEIVDQLVFSTIDDTPHHDLLILPDGKVLYLAERTTKVDDSANGGGPETNVTGDVIRLWDQRSGTTEELWSAFEHLSIADRVVWGDGQPKRWTHFNSVQMGPRGNIVVSSRNRNQVISISPDFGSVEWYLDGPNATYRIKDPADRFYRQHTASQLPNGNILMFDNGTGRPEEEGGEYSRALELALVDYEGTAVKVWEYRPSPDIFSTRISSAFRMENGNTLVNFGTTPDVTRQPITLVEVDREGQELWKLEMTGPALQSRFRAYPLDSIMGEESLSAGD